MSQELKAFIDSFEQKFKPTSKAAAIAYFDATISGGDAEYKRAADLEIEMTRILSNKEDFAVLKNIKDNGVIADPMLTRQMDVLYTAYLSHQIDQDKLEAMIRLENENEKKFATFRAEIDGKKYTDNELEDILKNSNDSRQLQAAWEASKTIGGVVSDDVLRLVRMRNEAARELGFANYHTMKLELSEQDPQEIESLFDELDALTRDVFTKLKSEMDGKLAARYGLKPEELMPWHYQNRFFQEAPKIYEVDLDQYYKNSDIEGLARQYYSGIGLEIGDLIKKSDLYEKEGKYQHAYCTDIDREGDVRVVCNIRPSYNWMNTTLHEFGHAVYDKYNDRDVPWLLREPAHTFTTEAVAMFFGRLASSPAWLTEVAGVDPVVAERNAQDIRNSLRLEQLVFSRWAQVMYRFEKAMYENPEQDLNALWWQLVGKYQMLRTPEGREKLPDWASKIHIALYPAYYHNYLMGELLASQFNACIAKTLLNGVPSGSSSFKNRKDVGEFFVKKVFAPGHTMKWNDMIERATGEKLTAKYYAEQFVN